MSIEGQGHFSTIYFPGFVCFVLYLAKVSGEHFQDHWSSGLSLLVLYWYFIFALYTTILGLFCIPGGKCEHRFSLDWA